LRLSFCLSGIFQKEEVSPKYSILTWLPCWPTVPDTSNHFTINIFEYVSECSFAFLEHVITVSLTCWHILVNVYLKNVFLVFPNSYLNVSTVTICIAIAAIFLSCVFWRCMNSKAHSVSRNDEDEPHPAMNRHWKLCVLCGVLVFFMVSYIWEFIRIYQIERAKKATVLFKVSYQLIFIPLQMPIFFNLFNLYQLLNTV